MSKLKQAFQRFHSGWDAKNLGDLEEKRPEIAQAIRELLELGATPETIGREMRHVNPQMWVESKFSESVARAILEENDG